MEKQREFIVSGCSLAAVALLRSKHHENNEIHISIVFSYYIENCSALP